LAIGTREYTLIRRTTDAHPYDHQIALSNCSVSADFPGDYYQGDLYYRYRQNAIIEEGSRLCDEITLLFLKTGRKGI
jgi:hypothetical protein